jgi:hypothetical protein
VPYDKGLLGANGVLTEATVNQVLVTASALGIRDEKDSVRLVDRFSDHSAQIMLKIWYPCGDKTIRNYPLKDRLDRVKTGNRDPGTMAGVDPPSAGNLGQSQQVVGRGVHTSADLPEGTVAETPVALAELGDRGGRKANLLGNLGGALEATEKPCDSATHELHIERPCHGTTIPAGRPLAK